MEHWWRGAVHYLVAVTVTVFWGERVLHVRALRTNHRFSLGVERGDYPAPPSILGTHHLQLLGWERERPWVTVPSRATSDCWRGPRRSNTGHPYRTSTAPRRVPLEPGDTMLVELGPLRVKVSHEANGSGFRRWTPIDRRLARFGALVVAVQLVLLAVAAAAIPPMGESPSPSSAPSPPRDSPALRLVRAGALPEVEEPPARLTTDADRAPVELPRDAHSHAGRLGREQPSSRGHWELMGPRDNPDPHVSRTRHWASTSVYTFGPLDEPSGGDPDAVVASWGRDTSLGLDDTSKRGALRGELAGDSWGSDPSPTSDRPGGLKKHLSFDHVERLPPRPPPSARSQREPRTTSRLLVVPNQRPRTPTGQQHQREAPVSGCLAPTTAGNACVDRKCRGVPT